MVDVKFSLLDVPEFSICKALITGKLMIRKTLTKETEHVYFSTSDLHGFGILGVVNLQNKVQDYLKTDTISNKTTKLHNPKTHPDTSQLYHQALSGSRNPPDLCLCRH